MSNRVTRSLLCVSIGVAGFLSSTLSFADEIKSCGVLFARYAPDYQARKVLVEALNNLQSPQIVEDNENLYYAHRYGGLAEELEQWLQSGKPFRPRSPWLIPTENRPVYKPSHSGRLAAEDGSQNVEAVRINFVPKANGSLASRGASLELLRDYIKVMEEIEDLKLWIVTSKSHQEILNFELEKIKRSVRNRIKIVTSEQHPVYWAQDGSKPLASGRASLLRASYSLVKGKRGEAVPNTELNWDAKSVGHTKSLQEAGLISAIESQIPFPGGNVVVGKEQAFVGTKVVQETMFHFKVPRTIAKKILQREFGVPVIELGLPDLIANDFYESAFHVDLDLALVQNTKTEGKKGTVFLESPSLFLETAFGFPPFHRLTKEEFFQQKLKALKNFEMRINAGEPLTYAEITLMNWLGEVPFEVVQYENMAHEVLKKQILAHGYDVEKIPGLSSAGKNEDNVGATEKRYAPLPYYNYTNVVVTHGYVLTPQYGIALVDHLARKTYEKLGYKTMPMNSTRLLIRLQGGCRCASETFRKPLVKN